MPKSLELRNDQARRSQYYFYCIEFIFICQWELGNFLVSGHGSIGHWVLFSDLIILLGFICDFSY